MASYTETMKRVMEGDFGDASEQERDEAVADVIRVGSIAAAAVVIQPIPFVDIATLSPIQITMVQAVGRVRGFTDLNSKSVLEILSTFGASIVAQNVLISAGGLLGPFLGPMVKVPMAYALTWAIGEVSDHYFKTGRGASPDELKSMFKKVYKQKKAEKEAAGRTAGTLKERLDQLKEAYAAGLLTEEEFQRKKEEMLADF